MGKERIIDILDYLTKNTDSERFVSIKNIKEHLEKSCGHEDVSVQTITRDIERLECQGKNIIKKRGAHNTGLYSLSDKGFTFNEIRFIVDSLSINKFLTAGQKQRLFKKFENMCSEAEIRRLISRIKIFDLASPDLNLLDNLEKVHRIISENCKINFEYGKYDINKQVQYYSKRRDLFPCEVVYFNERFYLKCINEEDGKVRIYRVDRMKNIVRGEKTAEYPALPKPEGAVVDIFEPDYYENVKFRVSRVLLDDMLEVFGSEAMVRDDFDDPSKVIVNVKVGISQGFYRWVMRYADNMEIISPENIRREFASRLKKVCEIYDAESL